MHERVTRQNCNHQPYFIALMWERVSATNKRLENILDVYLLAIWLILFQDSWLLSSDRNKFDYISDSIYFL